MITIVIVDDHPFFRLGIKEYLSQYQNYKVVGEVGTGAEAIELAESLNPHIMIMDVDMPGTNGIDATNIILKNNPDVKIIALSRFEKENDIMDMLKAGSKGLLLKSGDAEELLHAIEKVLKDEEFYSRKAVEVIIHRFARGNPDVKSLLRIPGFSDREMEIIKLICQQKTAKEIGQILFVSEKTVDFHRQKIIEKMNVKNIIGLVVFAIKKGLVSIDELDIKT
jgi:DNA-binding NarL/FixJ family response regulator